MIYYAIVLEEGSRCRENYKVLYTCQDLHQAITEYLCHHEKYYNEHIQIHCPINQCKHWLIKCGELNPMNVAGSILVKNNFPKCYIMWDINNSENLLEFSFDSEMYTKMNENIKYFLDDLGKYSIKSVSEMSKETGIEITKTYCISIPKTYKKQIKDLTLLKRTIFNSLLEKHKIQV